MNTPMDQPWSQPQETVDNMAHMSNDLGDLSNIFDMADFDLDAIPNIDTTHYAEHLHSHPGTPFNENMNGGALPGSAVQDFGTHDDFGISNGMDAQSQFLPQSNMQPTNVTLPYVTEPMYQPSMPTQMYSNHMNQFQPQPHQHYPPAQQVPPTPNSFELHGEAGRFMQQEMEAQQRAMLEQHQYHLRKQEQMQFTPMASPAGNSQYGLQLEYTVPGAYFSPLTSPALHAQSAQHNPRFQQQHQQHQNQPHQGYYTNPSTAPSSTAPSPTDPADIEMGDDLTLPGPAAPQAKRTRKKLPAPRSAGLTQNSKQSPIQKPQKRKSATLSSVISPKEMDNVIAEAQRSGRIQPGSAGVRVPPAFDSSENGSISPEPLSEALMGPPPRPGSSLTSPVFTGQQPDEQGKAATPKSLLSKRGSTHAGDGETTPSQAAQAGVQNSLEELHLPEAASRDASRRPSLSQINTQIKPSAVVEQAPRSSARKTPKLGPLSTPSSARPLSAAASPSIAPSAMTASTPAALLKDRKVDGKSGKGSKKRGSVSASSSTLLSPAIRPRISPSIKPLLPEGTTLNSPTHALLLASKSNYQNLLEGNHLPGVNYPESLSSGLTSKRTSHKVAEQGRRNRINEALKEMQALIPAGSSKSGGSDENGAAGDEESPEAPAEGDSKETKEAKEAAKSNSSKAATVESANRYIRQLKESEASQKAALMAMKREMDEMRCKLEEATAATARTSLGPSDGESEKGTTGLPKVEEESPAAGATEQQQLAIDGETREVEDEGVMETSS